MRIAMFGAGGVGGYFGGRFAQAGHSVILIARAAHLEALRRNGLRLETPEGDVVTRPEATDTPAIVGPVDAVFVCVKAWQLAEAARAMLPMVGPQTLVIPLQNGVDAADQVAETVGADRVLGGLCHIVSYRAGPGHIRHAGIEPRLGFGDRSGRRAEQAAALLAALRGAPGVRLEVHQDIEAAIWAKFCFLAPLAGVGALTQMPAGRMRELPETRGLLVQAVTEVCALARARRINLLDDAVSRTLATVDALPADATSSMQRDVMSGRPSELEALTGSVVRLAKDAHVSVPTNTFIYQTLLRGELLARRRVG